MHRTVCDVTLICKTGSWSKDFTVLIHWLGSPKSAEKPKLHAQENGTPARRGSLLMHCCSQCASPSAHSSTSTHFMPSSASLRPCLQICQNSTCVLNQCNLSILSVLIHWTANCFSRQVLHLSERRGYGENSVRQG